MYQIVTADLASTATERAIHNWDGFVRTNRSAWTSSRLAYNLDNLWAWNIRGMKPEFAADGPCVFIEFQA
jgi:hypothetical protein